MKQIFFSTAALLVLAGSTYAVSTPVAMAQTTSKPRPKPAAIPVPVCPISDPTGCHIYG